MRHSIKTLTVGVVAVVNFALTIFLGLTSVQALTAPTSGKYQYFGTLMITATTTTTNCSNAGYYVGYVILARLRPPSLGINGTNWNFNVFNDYSSHSYSFSLTPTSKLSTANYAYWIGGGSGPFDVNPQISITSQTPTKISTSTTSVYIEGKIRNFDGNALYALTASNYDGCDITFRFSGVLKP